MKKLGFFLGDVIGFIWLIIPHSIRLALITGLIFLESRGRNPSVSLKRLFYIKNRLEWIINQRATVYGGGQHPKHRLTSYHNFFVDRIKDGERVLDVGCGNGAVARSIAFAKPKSTVVGIDLNHTRILEANTFLNPVNLDFIEGDILYAVPAGDWDVIILSNILEHIDDRVGFLKALQVATLASNYLIRVPNFERDWQMALRKELGVDFRSDSDHKIEHTLQELQFEITSAGLEIIELLTQWGEIWARCGLVVSKKG